MEQLSSCSLGVVLVGKAEAQSPSNPREAPPFFVLQWATVPPVRRSHLYFFHPRLETVVQGQPSFLGCVSQTWLRRRLCESNVAISQGCYCIPERPEPDPPILYRGARQDSKSCTPAPWLASFWPSRPECSFEPEYQTNDPYNQDKADMRKHTNKVKVHIRSNNRHRAWHRNGIHSSHK